MCKIICKTFFQLLPLFSEVYVVFNKGCSITKSNMTKEKKKKKENVTFSYFSVLPFKSTFYCFNSISVKVYITVESTTSAQSFKSVLLYFPYLLLNYSTESQRNFRSYSEFPSSKNKGIEMGIKG